MPKLNLSILKNALFCLLLIFLPFISFNLNHPHDLTENITPQIIEEGWQFQYAPATVAKPENLNSLAWQPLSTFTWQEKPSDSILWLQVKLSNMPFQDASLAFMGFNHPVQFFINNELLRFKQNISRDSIHDWYIVPLPETNIPETNRNKVLTLRVNDYSSVFSIFSAQLLYGNRFDLMFYLIRKDLDKITFGSFFLFLALISLIVYYKRPYLKTALHFSLLAISLGLATVSRTYTKQLFLPDPEIWFYISVLAFSYFPVALCFFIEQFTHETRRHIPRRLGWAYLIGYILIAACLYWEWLKPQTINQFFAVSTLPLFIVLYPGLLIFHDPRIQKTTLLGFLLFAIFGLHDLIVSLSSVASSYYLMHWGMFYLIMALTYASLLRYEYIQNSLDSSNRELKLKNLALEQSILELSETTAAKEKIESELRVAGKIQQSLLPRYSLRPSDQIQLHAFMEPAKEVGGDFYDYFFIDSEHLGIVVGDVSGKGVPAALFMAVSKTLIKAKTSLDLTPGEILNLVNHELCKDNELMYTGVIFGILDLVSRQFIYSNAGHFSPYLLQNNGTLKALETHGIPLGMIDHQVYGYDTLQLQSNQILLFYTDGIIDAQNEQGQRFTSEKFKTELAQSTAQTPDDLIDQIYKKVKDFAGETPQIDDITLLALKVG